MNILQLGIHTIFMSSKCKDIFTNINTFVFQHLLLPLKYLTCANRVDNFKVSVPSSTSFICLALAGFYVLLSIVEFHFSTHCCRFPLRVSLRWIYFATPLLIFSTIFQYEVMYANHCIFFNLRQGVSFVACALRHV